MAVVPIPGSLLTPVSPLQRALSSTTQIGNIFTNMLQQKAQQNQNALTGALLPYEEAAKRAQLQGIAQTAGPLAQARLSLSQAQVPYLQQQVQKLRNFNQNPELQSSNPLISTSAYLTDIYKHSPEYQENAAQGETQIPYRLGYKPAPSLQQYQEGVVNQLLQQKNQSPNSVVGLYNLWHSTKDPQLRNLINARIGKEIGGGLNVTTTPGGGVSLSSGS